MEKRDGMVRVKARDDQSGKEFFDYVRICDLQRLIDEGYVVALWEDIPQTKEVRK